MPNLAITFHRKIRHIFLSSKNSRHYLITYACSAVLPFPEFTVSILISELSVTTGLNEKSADFLTFAELYKLLSAKISESITRTPNPIHPKLEYVQRDDIQYDK